MLGQTDVSNRTLPFPDTDVNGPSGQNGETRKSLSGQTDTPQFKSVTDNIGTFSRDDPDMRFSLSSDAYSQVYDADGSIQLSERFNAADDDIRYSLGDLQVTSDMTDDDIIAQSREYDFGAYRNASDAIMATGKGYDESLFHTEVAVVLDLGDGDWTVDFVKGLNPAHAMERARRNWPDAKEIRYGGTVYKANASYDPATGVYKRFSIGYRGRTNGDLPAAFSGKNAWADHWLNKREAAGFWHGIGQLKLGNTYPQAENGNYIIAVGNKLVYTDGTYVAPHITRVISINSSDGTIIGDVSHIIYEQEANGYDADKTREILVDMYG